MKNKYFYCLLLVFLALLLLVAITRYSGFYRGSNLVVNFLQSPEENLQFSNNRTNVLFLGIGGGEHEAAALTDTIIFASIDIKSGDTVMLSIPRDIWLDSLQAKINTAYYYGRENGEEAGFLLAKQSVEEIVGQQIHYIFLIDFNGFVKAIDLVGGIDVYVDRAFDDYQYPIAGKENDDCSGDPEFACRYQHLHFDSGWQKMDGEKALQFVRSRHAQNEEGTDFARSLRQQKIIEGLKNKLVSAKFLTNPGQWGKLVDIAKEYVRTWPALTDQEIASFANILVRFLRNQSIIRTLTLDTGTQESPGFLTNPSEEIYGQWVLIPPNNDWTQFQQYLKDKISNGF